MEIKRGHLHLLHPQVLVQLEMGSPEELNLAEAE